MIQKPIAIKTGPCVVLVEDDTDDQELFMEVMERISPNPNIRMLCDGDELITLLDAIVEEQRLPTLIVLDYNLIRQGGEATLAQLKKSPRYHPIPVVVYSTSMTAKKEQDLLDLGAKFCRKKPTTMEGINHLISELMAYAHLLYTSKESQ